MPLVTDMLPTGPTDEERAAWERASRAQIRRIFAAVLEDRWTAVYDLYREAQEQGEWLAVAVWAGLPGTVKGKLRELEHEHANLRTGRGPDRQDFDVDGRP